MKTVNADAKIHIENAYSGWKCWIPGSEWNASEATDGPDEGDWRALAADDAAEVLDDPEGNCWREVPDDDE